ncbi:MAG: hypothetical protein MJZ36_10875, partial [Bacteroidaceae bacterium]|nr:hypothetical protein [Bacteroidaceae bacterium]
NTTDSGPVIPGSSPGIPTKREIQSYGFESLFFIYLYSMKLFCGKYYNYIVKIMAGIALCNQNICLLLHFVVTLQRRTTY